jgi:chromosomal replication initiator protein
MMMNYGGMSGHQADRTAGAVAVADIWAKVSEALRGELGEAAFSSWLGQAGPAEAADGALVLVTPTSTGRDWVRRNAWRRIHELWTAADPMRRPLGLMARADFPAAASESGGEPAAEAAEDAPPARPAGQPAARPPRPAGLQDRFTFDTFVSGPSNEFARDIALKVAGWSDAHFNPILVHGPYGYGKSHLLNAIAWEASRREPSRKVIYMPAERFLAGFVRAMMDKSGPAFKDEVRSAHLLLIDDVQIIAGKPQSQDELFHTIAALAHEGRRVVVTSDRPPNELTEIDARLRSHVQAGLVCGIEPADRTLRLGILELKLALLARQQNLTRGGLRSEVMEFLADRFTDSVRELEGALNTLVARAGERIGHLALDEAQSILRPHLHGTARKVTVDEIQKTCADYWGMKQSDLLSERRSRAIARPRQAAMWLTKQLTTRSLPDIGRRFGGRDHTTVLHAVRRIEELKLTDAQLARDLEQLTRKLGG